ncbi:hypothetical protein CSB09_00985 [Candidatus Gracilibacteria bacterium]|nr:MAG: hypothetical protein CSB09_00985 [Candidatus Gracilibacteria bacterium]
MSKFQEFPEFIEQEVDAQRTLIPPRSIQALERNLALRAKGAQEKQPVLEEYEMANPYKSDFVPGVFFTRDDGKYKLIETKAAYEFCKNNFELIFKKNSI